MILVTFASEDGYKLGIKLGDQIMDVAVAAEGIQQDDVPTTPNALFASALDSLGALQQLVSKSEQHPNADWMLEESSVAYGPCVPEPSKIMCVGLNYRKHAAESGMAEPSTPVLFSKFNNTVAAPNEDVPLPAVGVEYDYEAELAVVIGKRAKNVSVEEALDYVLGYCNADDLSARDLQMLTGQWLLGKTLDKFFPTGPYLVTADEAGDPQDMEVRCWLNGELRQESNTADMIFSVAEIISYASKFMTLESGDVITTGTPEGVILGMNPKVWMKPGDEAVVEIGNLGRLVNKMVAE